MPPPKKEEKKPEPSAEQKELDELRAFKAKAEADAAEAAKKAKDEPVEDEPTPAMSDEEQTELKALRKFKKEQDKAKLETLKKQLKARKVPQKKLDELTVEQAELLLEYLPEPASAPSRSPLPPGKGVLDDTKPLYPTNEAEARAMGFAPPPIDHQAKVRGQIPAGPDPAIVAKTGG